MDPLGPFLLGIEIGTSGIGGNDIQSTSFSISHTPGPLALSMVDGEAIAVRITTVGPAGGTRNDSLKVTGTTPGTTPVPEPGILGLIGIGLMMLGLVVKRRRIGGWRLLQPTQQVGLRLA